MLSALKPTIDFHPSVREGALGTQLAESLQANRIDPKLLYVAPRQADLWRQVNRRHSPIHDNPEFARIYQDAFVTISESLPPGKIWLVGLGCGTGLKEADLCSHLKSRGYEVQFSAIDVSRDLVVESAQKLVAAGADHRRSLVCDLGETDFLAEWLGRGTEDMPRLYTFFGLVPNLAPSLVARLFRSVLRPKRDVLLVSAHLAPVSDGVQLPEAMRSVLPQYDNPETLAWLTAGLEQWELKDRLDPPEMKIGEIEGVPAFIATAKWKHGEKEPLQLFHSLRYTPELFENLLRSEGFEIDLLAMTSCREEAIWAIGSGTVSKTVPLPGDQVG